MSSPRNAFEVFQFLDKSNCGQCGEKTCLAFAGAVFLGQRRIHECPKLSPEILERFREETDAKGSHEPSPEDRLEKLKSQVAQIDLAKADASIRREVSFHSLLRPKDRAQCRSTQLNVLSTAFFHSLYLFPLSSCDMAGSHVLSMVQFRRRLSRSGQKPTASPAA